MKKIFILGLVFGITLNLFAVTISQEQCDAKKDGFIFAGGECIQYVEVEGDKKDTINIIVHGTWREGTDTLARYTPFAETINMSTDITTIAVALPGYSQSSTNKLQSLSHDSSKNLATKKAYIEFLSKLVSALKGKYNASTVNYIGHSAGASMGATLTGYSPNLINTISLAGARYKSNKKDSAYISTYLDNLSKNTKYLLIYGTKDKISKPKATKDFYAVAKKKGLDVKIVEAKDAVHLDLDMTDASVDAISEMLE